MQRTRLLSLLVLAVALAGLAAPAASRDDTAEEVRPTLVLVHGLGSSAGVWDRLIPFLIDNFRVYTYEMPGHGRTPTIDHSTIENVVVHLSAYITEHDIARPLLVGHAMGGLVAMQYAFAHPDEVRGLVVIDAAPIQLATTAEKTTITSQLMDNYDFFVANRFMSMSTDSEMANLVVDQALRTDSATLITMLMDSFDFNMLDELERQDTRILVVGSRLFFPDGRDEFETVMRMGYVKARNVNYKRIGESGHFVMLEDPVELARSITGFAGGPIEY